MLFDWFKILRNLEEKNGKNEGEIHAILCKYSFPVSRMEFESATLQSASNYMKNKQPLFTFSVAWKKFLQDLTQLEK